MIDDGIKPLQALEAAHAAFCNPANRGYSLQAAIGAYHARIIGQKAIGSEEPLDPTALYTACEVMLAVRGDQAALPEGYANEVSAAIRAYLATSRALAPLPAPMPGDMAETIALIRKRMKSGECDLRDVGQILTGRFDQDVPAAILAAAAAQAAVPGDMVEAAQRIFEAMCGRPVDWAKHAADTNEDNLFQSADWECCLSYAKAALAGTQPVPVAVKGLLPSLPTPTEHQRRTT
ncbi:MAG: hypothetical protein E5Y67_12495 [Mesorhizobium sp.]|uniref:hypothetical protein n=1 Tax=Mesorhizobium sp. TaxID=1871066 RepID=UPI00121147BF|nr:hypothetical protein [Mesorhizobium sp.]TIM14491.1 MAG: hypothetical protein E5Y67_12495 [Mesorhizobium sp.]